MMAVIEPSTITRSDSLIIDLSMHGDKCWRLLHTKMITMLGFKLIHVSKWGPTLICNASITLFSMAASYHCQHSGEVQTYSQTNWRSNVYANIGWYSIDKTPRPVSTWRPSSPAMESTMLKIRRSRDRLILNMGIPILVRRHLYIETAPRFKWQHDGVPL